MRKLYCNNVIKSFILTLGFKGSDSVDMVVKLKVQYCTDIFRIHLRPLKGVTA